MVVHAFVRICCVDFQTIITLAFSGFHMWRLTFYSLNQSYIKVPVFFGSNLIYLPFGVFRFGCFILQYEETAQLLAVTHNLMCLSFVQLVGIPLWTLMDRLPIFGNTGKHMDLLGFTRYGPCPVCTAWSSLLGLGCWRPFYNSMYRERDTLDPSLQLDIVHSIRCTTCLLIDCLYIHHPSCLKSRCNKHVACWQSINTKYTKMQSVQGAELGLFFEAPVDGFCIEHW